MVETDEEQDKGYDEASPSLKVGMDLEAEVWAENEEEESSGQDEIPE